MTTGVQQALIALLEKAGVLIDGHIEDRDELRAELNAERAQAALEVEEAESIVQDCEVEQPPDTSRERENDVITRPFSPNSLVSSWFTRWDNGRLQGCVVAEPQAGIYLVEIHSWQDGSASHQEHFTLKEMVEDHWRFYDSDEWMRLDHRQLMERAETA